MLTTRLRIHSAASGRDGLSSLSSTLKGSSVRRHEPAQSVSLCAVAPGSEHVVEVAVDKLDPVREVTVEPRGEGLSVEKLSEDGNGCVLRLTAKVPWKKGTQANGVRLTGGEGSTWIPVLWTVEPPFELSKRYLKEEQFRLYQLIWQRIMASQMAAAIFDTTTLDFSLEDDGRGSSGASRFLFRATGSVVKFPGFLALYRESREEGEGKALEDEQALPVAALGDRIPMLQLTPAQHFTEPPPRFSEASLVKELEKLGIGRPSTYAQIISTLQDRHYVTLEQRRFFPTPLGESVERVMVKQFPDIFNVRFTSSMEGELEYRYEQGIRQYISHSYAAKNLIVSKKIIEFMKDTVSHSIHLYCSWIVPRSLVGILRVHAGVPDANACPFVL